LRFVSQAADDGTLDLNALCSMNAESAMTAMTAISGIGPWTAEVYLLFCAGHPDIFPSGDIALQNAMQMIFSLQERPTAKQAAQFAKDWSPHRGTAARLLWAYYGVMRGGLKSPL
jgi:DNA-3-methyladenine glycosylase II